MKCAKCEEQTQQQTMIQFQFNTVHALLCRPCSHTLWQWIYAQPDHAEIRRIVVRRDIETRATGSIHSEAEQRLVEGAIERAQKTDAAYTELINAFTEQVLEQLPSFGQEYSEFE